MRDLRVPLLLLAILCVMAGMFVRADSKAKYDASPKSINERGESLANQLGKQADLMNELYSEKKWTEEEWQELLFRNQLIVNKLKSSFFEMELCESKKEQDYCDHSSRDLDEAEVELNTLDKAIVKAGQISL